jgi:hypothetical protein
MVCYVFQVDSRKDNTISNLFGNERQGSTWFTNLSPSINLFPMALSHCMVGQLLAWSELTDVWCFLS